MMQQPRFSFVPVGRHELHVTEWGARDAPAIVLWHGLARTGRDFDELAAALSQDHFVLCPDTIGRGLSSWAPAPETDYSLKSYANLAIGMLDHYQIARAGWLGTSMGGLIGMRIASGAYAARLSFLVVNDIGPELPQSAVDRIIAYAGSAPVFAYLHEAENWFRTAYLPFGPAPAPFWTRMTRTSLRRCSDGRLTTHYDPEIVVQFTASASELTSWERYRRITLPTHLIWGTQSDLLTADIVARMSAQGPRPDVTAFADCGHAPSLAQPEAIAEVRRQISRLEDLC
ncbi:alpha/beta hydrolase [Martelella sp. HB161492]|uniref:alpha/beta fold hydrolase n=1 Tax=Martelella sp. HB161492 TaxID=2720726 RepID=UPI001AED49D6|nr:alpha/beta hydrolase [Martelella sp. HB161492]